MTTITVQRPATIRVPRAAPIAAAIAFKLLDGIERLVTTRRARRVGIERLVTTRRARRAEADRVAEAAAVRRYADEVRALDPRFAADLCAAADRHEIA